MTRSMLTGVTCLGLWPIGCPMLPAGVLLEMMSFCGPEDLCRAAMVCKLWKSIADKDVLWRRHCHPLWSQEHSQAYSYKQLYLKWIHKQAIRYCHKQRIPWITQEEDPLTSSNYDFKLKILVIGDNGVGKSGIIERFTENTFSPNYRPTISANFKIKNIIVDGFKVLLKIWDTAGQQRFRNLTSVHYRHSDGVLLVFDVGHLMSFNNLKVWIDGIKEAPKQCVQLIGNKLDAPRVVTKEQAQEFAEKHQLIYSEVSAKTGQNLNEVFENLSRLSLYHIHGIEPLPPTLPNRETFLTYAKKLLKSGNGSLQKIKHKNRF